MAVTYLDIQGLVDADLCPEDLQAFVDDAALWVANNLTGKCPGLDSDKTDAITKYLAAHFATIGGEGTALVAATRGDISERYAQLGKGQTSRFIQLAAAFDPCGIIEEQFTGAPRFKAYVGAGYMYGGGP